MESEINVCKYCNDDERNSRTEQTTDDSLYQIEADDYHQQAKAVKNYIFHHSYYLNNFLNVTGIGVVNSIGSLVIGW